jgi:hypothetical protein
VLIPKEDISAAVAKILDKDVAEVEAMLARVSGPPPPPPGEENGSEGDGEEEHWLVQFIREINHSNRHPVSGRPLEPHEYSVLWAAAYACWVDKPKRRFPPSRPAVVRMPWTVDLVLLLLGIHENTRRGQELKRYLESEGWLEGPSC